MLKAIKKAYKKERWFWLLCQAVCLAAGSFLFIALLACCYPY